MEDWKRIILAIDDSSRSMNAVEYVASIVGCQGNIHLCLLHIYPEPPPGYYSAGLSLSEYKKTQEQQASQLFTQAEEILKKHNIPAASIESKCLMAENKSISAAILDMQVHEHYGTIVVGKRGIPKSEEFLFGSISNALVHTGKDIAVWVVG